MLSEWACDLESPLYLTQLIGWMPPDHARGCYMRSKLRGNRIVELMEQSSFQIKCIGDSDRACEAL